MPRQPIPEPHFCIKKSAKMVPKTIPRALLSKSGGLLGSNSQQDLHKSRIWTPFWSQVGPSWSLVGPSWVQDKQSWGLVGPSWGQVGAKLRPSWAKLGPDWPNWKLSWVQNVLQHDIKTDFHQNLKKLQKMQYVLHFWGVGSFRRTPKWNQN